EFDALRSCPGGVFGGVENPVVAVGGRGSLVVPWLQPVIGRRKREGVVDNVRWRWHQLYFPTSSCRPSTVLGSGPLNPLSPLAITIQCLSCSMTPSALANHSFPRTTVVSSSMKRASQPPASNHSAKGADLNTPTN